MPLMNCSIPPMKSPTSCSYAFTVFSLSATLCSAAAAEPSRDSAAIRSPSDSPVTTPLTRWKRVLCWFMARSLSTRTSAATPWSRVLTSFSSCTIFAWSSERTARASSMEVVTMFFVLTVLTDPTRVKSS